MKKNNQKGSTVVILLVIAIVLVLVGFVGWYVWDKHSKKQKDTNTSQKTNDTKSNSSTTGQQSSQQQNSKNYLVITEWGVKIPLTSEIYDAAYSLNGSNAAGMQKSSFTDISPSCKSSGGTIVRFSDPNQLIPAPDGSGPSSSTYGQIYGTSLKVGNYYYGFLHPQGLCGGDTGSGENPSEQSQLAAIAAFKVAVNSVQAAN